MWLTLLAWYGIIGSALSLTLLVWLIGTARLRLHMRTSVHPTLRSDEPILPQFWRFVRVLASTRGVGALLGSFSAFEPARLNRLAKDARHPWGIRSAIDVYAIGLITALLLELAFLYLSSFNPLAFATIPLSLMLGMALPVLALHLVARGVRQAMLRDLWTLMNVLELYLAAGYPLYDALREALPACPYLSPYLDRMLLRWGSVGPAAALDDLAADLQLPEAHLVIGALRQAVDHSPASLATFMLRESMRLDRAMDAAHQRSTQIKPLLQQAVLVLPAVNAFLLLTAPWAYAVYLQLQAGLGF